jgi:hypothetical protein
VGDKAGDKAGDKSVDKWGTYIGWG